MSLDADKGPIVDSHCDETYLKQSSLEAFCGIADPDSVSIIQHDKPATIALPQSTLARTFDTVSAPQYAAPVVMPSVWDINPRDRDFKRHGMTVDKDKDYLKVLFNNCLLSNAEITLKHTDRITIEGVGLCEILSLHSDRDMSGLRFNTEIIAYLVD